VHYISNIVQQQQQQQQQYVSARILDYYT
jgi:hypothetical protein